MLFSQDYKPMSELSATPDTLQLGSRIKYLSNQLLIRNEQLSALKSVLQSLSSQKQNLTSTNQQLTKSIYKAELKVVRKEYDNLSKKLQSAEQDNIDLKKELRQRIAKEKERETRYKEIERRMEAIEKDRHKVDQQLRDHEKAKEKEIKKAKAELKQSNRREKELEDFVRDLEKERSLDTVEVVKLRKMNEGFVKKVQQQQKKIEQLKHVIADKTRLIDETQKKNQQIIQQLSEFEQLKELQHEKILKEDLRRQATTLSMLKQQHQKIVNYYIDEITSLKQQLLKQVTASSTSRLHEPKQSIDVNKPLFQLLSNSLAYGSAYTSLLNPQSQFRGHPQHLKVFLGIRSLLHSQATLNEQLAQLTKQNEEYDERIKLLSVEVLELRERTKVAWKELEAERQRMKEQFERVKESREVEVAALEDELAEARARVGELEEKGEQVVGRMEEQVKVALEQATKRDPEHLLEVNDENTKMKVKCFQAVNIIEILVSVVSTYHQQMSVMNNKLKYYRMYEQFYWSLFQPQPCLRQAYSLKSSQSNLTIPRSNNCSRLRKAFTSVLFLKHCQLRYSKTKSRNPHLLISQLVKNIQDRRLAYILSKQGHFGERLVLNSVLSDLRGGEVQGKNQYSWVVELVKQENINAAALEGLSGEGRQVYPGELFRRCVVGKRNRLEEFVMMQQPTYMRNCMLQTNSMARSQVNMPQQSPERTYFERSRRPSRQCSRLHDLKRQLDQAMHSRINSQFYSPVSSPRLCGTIRPARRPIL